MLQPEDLSPVRSLRAANQAAAGDEGSKTTLRDAVEAAERQVISAVLAAVGGNRRVAAQRLGVSLRTLFYKMQRYRLT
jgi:DNA-binding NtrC family response regulator